MDPELECALIEEIADDPAILEKIIASLDPARKDRLLRIAFGKIGRPDGKPKPSPRDQPKSAYELSHPRPDGEIKVIPLRANLNLGRVRPHQIWLDGVALEPQRGLVLKWLDLSDPMIQRASQHESDWPRLVQLVRKFKVLRLHEGVSQPPNTRRIVGTDICHPPVLGTRNLYDGVQSGADPGYAARRSVLPQWHALPLRPTVSDHLS